MAKPACNRDPHFSGGHHQPGSPALVVNPSARHTHTMILLHGLASHGAIFGRDLLRAGRASSGRTLDGLFPGVRFVFPTAQRRPCQALEGAKVALWFDVASLRDPGLRQDLQRRGLCISAREIAAILLWETKLVPAGNVVLGGMGQGCATALTVLLSLGYRLGGVIGMSGFLPYQFELEMNTAESSSDEDDDSMTTSDGHPAPPRLDPAVKAQVYERNLLQLKNLDHPTKDQTSFGTPVFLGHGADDRVVSVALGEQATVALRAAEYKVHWRRYEDHGHGYKVPEEIDDIVEFMRTEVGLEPRDG
ncbi:Acyl-protein thioesterase 1 [Tolypocladium paradoxum]|uniref:Acyl-protein thioesterase 1 n=1 Tax=Tolypocladium paradoxum TaxID=94208 RepID=A0A2S4L8R2_9HYPO|nr:Acyl-protein thioesterase 1 [Tolypocladium paradoxum]